MFKSPNRMLGIIFGAVYILVGLWGFTVTSTVGFMTTSGELLVGVFEVNPLLNVAHLILGAALLIAGLAGVTAAKITNGTVGALLLIVGIVGFFIVDTTMNVLALNTADHYLHLVSAVVLVAVALAAERTLTSDAMAPAEQRAQRRTSDTD